MTIILQYTMLRDNMALPKPLDAMTYDEVLLFNWCRACENKALKMKMEKADYVDPNLA